MVKQRTNGHTVSYLTCHIVWSTKYRYKVLSGDVQKRCRKLLIQICESEDIQILKGVVSKDHIINNIDNRPFPQISYIIKEKPVYTNNKRTSPLIPFF